jgi:phosphoglycolate phosphatase
MVKYIIFDFDGTIADTYPIVKHIYETERKKYKAFREFDFSDIRKIGLKKSLKEIKMFPLRLLFVARKLEKKYEVNLKNLSLIKNMDIVIRKLSTKYKLGILTSNHYGPVSKILREYNLEKYFEFIETKRNLFGKHKAMHKIMKKNDLISDDIIYVGDEDRDFNSMRKIDIKMICVTWGFNSKKYLESLNADLIANKPSDILSILLNYKENKEKSD